MKKNYLIFTLAIFLLLLVSLTMMFGNFFEAYPWLGKFQVQDPDSMLFLRYYEQSLLQGELIQKDTYGCFPSEIKNDFPPFHLKFLLGITDLYYYFFPESNLNTDFVIGWLPPFIGWLCSLMIIFFCWYKTRSMKLCLLVAFAAIPGYYSNMTFAYLRVDYHFFNAFFIQLWLILAAVFAIKRNSGLIVFAGIVVSLFLATWQASPLFFLFASLYGIFLIFTKSQIADHYVEYISNSLIIGAILASLLFLPKDSLLFKIEGFNLFHVSTVLFAGVFFKVIDYLKKEKKISYQKLVSFITVFTLFFITALFAFSKDHVLYGLSLLTAKEPLMATIGELKPVFYPDVIFLQPFKFLNSYLYLGLGVLFLPVIFIFNPAKIFSSGGRILRDWFLIISVLTIYSVRFGRWIGSLPMLFTGCALYMFCEMVWRELKTLELSDNKKNIFKLATVILPYFIIVFILNYTVLWGMGGTVSADKMEAFNWIRKNTPKTAGYEDLEQPEYGILAYWDEGNAISYYAHRPTLANNSLKGYKKMAQIFSAQTEDQAIKFCKKYSVRYIYLSDRNVNDKTIDMMHIYKNLPNNPTYEFTNAFGREAKRNQNHLYNDSFHYWLARQAAIKPAGNFLEPTSQFRIVYSSLQENRFVAPQILFYEFVPGCEIKGVGDPYTKVILSIGCRFDKANQLYKRQVQTGADGSFSIRVPYSCKYYKGRVETEEFYKISFYKNNKLYKAKLIVSNEDVVKGERLEVEQNMIPVNLER